MPTRACSTWPTPSHREAGASCSCRTLPASGARISTRRRTGVLLGLTASHGRAELVRAVVEGITLGCYDASRALADAGRLGLDDHARRGRRRKASSGSGSSPTCSGFPSGTWRAASRQRSGPASSPVAGSARLIPASAASAWARLGPVIEPDPDRHEPGAVYDVFRDGYPSLRRGVPEARRARGALALVPRAASRGVAASIGPR